MPRTKGLSANLGSRAASGATRGSSDRMPWLQKEMPRGVSEASSPCRDLNHWRFSSTMEIIANGTSKTLTASLVMRSKRSSGGVSRMARLLRALSRLASSGGRGAAGMNEVL
ncbi:MAG: hypothetical protein HY748_16275 [Elusimicrobia bacterium]|nr:hypothetical protein [Elusimicrobiota bacterium]